MVVAVRDGNQWVLRGRNLVTSAFSPVGEAPITPMAVFSGKSKDQKSKRSLSPNPMGLSPTRIYATESAHAKYSRPPRGAKAGAGPILALIAQLPPLEQLWIHHRYRSHGYTKRRATEQFHHHYRQRYLKKHMNGKNQKTSRVVIYLIHLHIWHSSFPNLWFERRPREIEQAISNNTLTLDSWRKTYAPHWTRIYEELMEIDRAGLEFIGRNA